MDASNLARRADLRFEDGNIVLVAGNTALCVHRGVLSLKSTVFSDMISVPQPDARDMVDGIPAVRLHDDPQDLIWFIDSMYNGSRCDI